MELPANVNPKLVEFSLDLALQEDPRFDEVGPAGEVLWYLHRLEPEEVRQTAPMPALPGNRIRPEPAHPSHAGAGARAGR